jgi:WD40 repeat protein
MMCPHTGSIHSSFRGNADMSGKAALGMSSVSLFPRKFSSANNNHHNSNNNINNNVLAMAYGKNVSKSTDTYAMLLTLRTSSTSPPILHWKCRLPEANLTAGLVVSPCGYYIAGGGASGTCFVWSSILGGKLLKIFKSHYRSCTTLVWSDCGKYLLTGGADGMVHVYSLLDLVDQSSGSNSNSNPKKQQQEQSVPPFHTWSVHHLPVTCLTTLDSGRVASSSDDGQVVVMELFSRTVVATIQLPHGIRCLDHHDGRLLAGSNHGEIYTMDLNAHAMRQTMNQGGGGATSNTKRRRVLHPQQQSLEETVFGSVSLSSSSLDPLEAGTASAAATDAPYYQPLQGHDRPVTALALLVEDDLQERLISGDESGTIRIWDMASRTCLRVVQPWSHSAFNNAVTTKAKADSAGAGAADTSTTSRQQQRHPVTSIQILRQDTESAFANGKSGGSLSGGMLLGHSSSGNSSESILSLLTPLQRFTSEDQDNSIPIPFLKPLGTSEEMEYWNVDASYPETYHRKPFHANDEDILSNKKEDGDSGDKAKLEDTMEEQRKQILLLQKELAERTSQVERWENVNNKLMAKLEAARK